MRSAIETIAFNSKYKDKSVVYNEVINQKILRRQTLWLACNPSIEECEKLLNRMTTDELYCFKEAQKSQLSRSSYLTVLNSRNRKMVKIRLSDHPQNKDLRDIYQRRFNLLTCSHPKIFQSNLVRLLSRIEAIKR